MQAACVPHILRGQDVIIAAETGSGKTHGYLVPLIHKLGAISAPSEDEITPDALQNNETILVLCPNVMLCDQVVGMANLLLDQSGKPLLKVAAVCGQKVESFLWSYLTYLRKMNWTYHKLMFSLNTIVGRGVPEVINHMTLNRNISSRIYECTYVISYGNFLISNSRKLLLYYFYQIYKFAFAGMANRSA